MASLQQLGERAWQLRAMWHLRALRHAPTGCSHWASKLPYFLRSSQNICDLGAKFRALLKDAGRLSSSNATPECAPMPCGLAPCTLTRDMTKTPAHLWVSQDSGPCNVSPL